MSDVFFLLLRRLRAPLICLIVVYAVATFGMTLVPGIDPNGEPWRMSFFHAFYFVSFMGTTIGFGEVPYEFTDAQRAWVLVCIYTSVITWLYAIGSMLRLLQDETFRHAIDENIFRRSIRRIDSPFYIICGYGETGTLINQGLSKIDIQTVIIDLNPDHTNHLDLQNLSFVPIVLNADATESHNLINAGLNHHQCQGVIAVTENDHTNLQVAVASKLLNSQMPVICRSEIEDEADNMDSFGTDIIINPYLIFAKRLNLLVHKPSLHKIQNWFINQHSAEHLTKRELPNGLWIICGFGRLGKAIHSHLIKDGIEIKIIDPEPEINKAPEGTIIGRGTEAKTLHEANILNASVIIAASNDDANNLSILITAQQINKDVYTIGRVNKESNQVLFSQAKCDYIMRRGQLVANEVLTSISRPLVSKFINYSKSLSQDDTNALISEIKSLTKSQDPITWRLSINKNNSPALVDHLDNKKSLQIGEVCSHPKWPKARCIPLLLLRGGVSHLLPSTDTQLLIGDQLLVCGNRKRLMLPQHLRENPELVDSLINNNDHDIPIIRWLSRKNNIVAN